MSEPVSQGGGADNILDVSQPEFGQRLRQLRQERRMSQRVLAGDQVTASYISLLEAGHRVPTLNVAVALARRLDTSLDELLGVDAHLLISSSQPPNSPLLAQVHANDANDIGDHDQARILLEEAIRQARRDGNQQQIVLLGMNLQDVLHAMNDHAARLELLDDMLSLPVVKGSAPTEMSLMTTKASALRDAGDLTAAKQATSAALRHTSDPAVAGGTEHVRLLGVLISVLCELRELDQVKPLVAELLELAAKQGRPSIAGRASWVATMAYTLVDEPDEAYRHLRIALDNLAYPSMSLREWLRFCRAVVRTLLDLERDFDIANSWLENAEAATRIINDPKDYVTVKALRARYELLVGNPGKALEIYESLDIDEADFTPLAVAQIRKDQARALRELDRASEAVEVLRHAADLCERGGAYQMAVQLWRQVDELTRPGRTDNA